MLTTALLYALILAHFNSYKQHYLSIFTSFAVTYMTKRLVKVIGSKDNADIVGLGGYSISACEFVKLVAAIKSSGFKVNNEETNQILGGVLGKGLDAIVDLLKKGAQ